MNTNSSPLSTQDKKRHIDRIEKTINAIKDSRLYHHRKENGYQPVMGEGDPDTKLMFIGEAPGKEEALSGKPFIGRAGQKLDSLLESIKIARSEVYITNIIKDRPPKNRDPLTEEIRQYAPFLWQQIAVIQPEIIATLGRIAMRCLLQHYNCSEYRLPIGERHGHMLEAKASFGSIKIFPLYHPAAVFYNHNLNTTMQEDFRRLARIYETIK